MKRPCFRFLTAAPFALLVGLLVSLVVLSACTYDSASLGDIACDESDPTACEPGAECVQGFCVVSEEEVEPEEDVGTADIDTAPQDVDDPDVETPDVEAPDVDIECGDEFAGCGDECVDTDENVDHCGSCDNACPAPDQGSPLCIEGTCDFECSDERTRCGDACIDTDANADHCGNCDNTCEGGDVCSEGECTKDCAQDLVACDGSCVDLQESPEFCGDCETSCESPTNGNAVCNDGECTVQCDVDYVRCANECVPLGNNFYEDCDGTCVDLRDDSQHCGECGQSCGGESSCDNGICCAPGLSNCNGECVDTDEDTEHCGGCGSICASDVDGSIAYCDEGACIKGCDEEEQTLCEDHNVCTDTNADDNHCGDCGHECITTVSAAQSVCDGGNCIDACIDDDDELCDDYDTCANLDEDKEHCGECGNACTAEYEDSLVSCSEGECEEECPTDFELCSDYDICADLETNVDHCGDCGEECDSGDVCIEGSCQADCGDGETDCDGACANLDESLNHCGECGNSCDTGLCVDGDCLCNPDYAGDFGGGDGSADSPFLICSSQHLNEIGDDFWMSHFELSDDIDFEQGAMSPIARADLPFNGVFDGKGYEISNFTIDLDENNIGMFRAVGTNGEVRDVVLRDVDINGNTHVGALVGFNRGAIVDVEAHGVVSGVSTVGGLIGLNEHSAHLSNTSTDTAIHTTQTAGGLVGLNAASATISNSTAHGDLLTDALDIGGIAGINAGTIESSDANGDIETALYRAGGLVGNNAGAIAQSSAHGNVSGGGDHIGGLVGLNAGSIGLSTASGDVDGGDHNVGGLVGLNSGPVAQSAASGNVEGAEHHVGGLIGHNGNNIDVNQTAATGDVTGGGSHVGGLIGINQGNLYDSYATGDVSGGTNVGGLVGYHWRTDSWGGNRDIARCHSIGSVSGGNNVGGLVGDRHGGCWSCSTANVSRSYWDTQTSGQSSSDGGSGLETGEFSSTDEFSTWNFDDPWEMSDALDGNTRPVLRWQDLH